MTDEEKQDWNDFTERFAAEILAHFVDKKYRSLHLRCNDKQPEHDKTPDMYSNSLNIGVEVTRSLSREEGKELNIIRQVFKGMKTLEEARSAGTNNIFEIKVALDDNEGEEIRTISKKCGFEISDSLVNIENIAAAINKKLYKLNHDPQYEKFQSNELFLYTDFLLNIEDLPDLKGQVNIEPGRLLFDVIYILSGDKLFVLDGNVNFQKMLICTLGRIDQP